MFRSRFKQVIFFSMIQKMHDIDAQIAKISGQENYMESLQKITGNIMTIDAAIFKEKHRKISACDFNIRLLLKRISDEQPNPSILEQMTQFNAESSVVNIKDGTFIMYQRKTKSTKNPPKPPREIIAPGHKPEELIKTPWFKMVKRIEKEVNKFITSAFPENTDQANLTYEYLANEYKQHPELVDIRTVYDCKVNSESIFKSFVQLRKCSNIIINILLTPMYDVKHTIRKHWNKIEQIFKSKAFQQTGIASPDDIVDMLNQFIIAKYRATITGNNKHYVKLFLNTIGNDNVSNMDGARFMEIMDSIDLDKLNKEDKVYKFALGAKTAMSKIVNNENVNAEDIIHELDDMFKDDPKVEEVNPEQSSKYDDIL